MLHQIKSSRSNKEKTMKNWIQKRIKERTTWDGGVCIALGVLVLFLSPLAKIAAGAAILYGAWTIWKAE